MNITASYKCFLTLALAAAISGCADDKNMVQNPNENVGKPVGNFLAAEWHPGGELGTTSNEEGCYSNPSPAVELQGLEQDFKNGETNFEHVFTLNSRPFKGLGPAWVRSGCEYCHPSYGHGKRQNEYKAGTMGNGYLLVIFHPTAGVDPDGVPYAKDSYIRQVTGMPQTQAMSPFKAPVDESQISIVWKKATDEHGNRFPDGETYDLTYPEVKIPQTAFRTNPLPVNYDVRLESTIGLYGTGLLDAIPQDSMKAQYAHEARFVELNPRMWNKEANDWAKSAWYTLADGSKIIKKFTYGMTRASLQDGPGANAIWNITNVTRSDRHYLYTTDAWAKAMSEDPEVIAGIQAYGKEPGSLLHPYYGDGSPEKIKELVNHLLGLNSKSDSAEYAKYFVKPFGGQEEMTDQAMHNFMVWHRGLGVPQARNLDSKQVQRGKELFYQMGCTACHRPSWKTTNDNYYADPITRRLGKKLPQYKNQTIWPYTDLVQHRLHMENDIRGGWCRTTPLWGRGLSRQETGAGERLHDCRARTVVEAIMWHTYSKKSDAYPIASKFYHLKKADRDAVVAFIEAI